VGYVSFGFSLASPLMVPTIDLLLDFCVVQVVFDVQIYMFHEKHKVRPASS
jgi:hypothetical protein